MRPIIVFLFVISFLFSCEEERKAPKKIISKVEIEILLEDSTLNVRALEVIKSNGGGYFVTSNGNGGIVNENTVIYPIKIDEEGKVVNFRSFASTKNGGFCLSIGSPTYLYKIGAEAVSVVYKETHPKAFYDSIAFWNDEEGIAIGDPTNDCLSVIITRDGGNTWNKLSCDDLPKAKEGEAAFAASDTNIKIIGDKTWVATGGKASRVLYSSNKGKTWEIFETPITQGLATTGMYSIDFYDELNGFAIGGDYIKAENNIANKIKTRDGGKTWRVVANGQNPGYRSCVQYIPNSNAQSLVAIGFNGIDISNDSGETWQHLSDDGYYTLRFLNDSTAYAAGKGRISKLLFN